MPVRGWSARRLGASLFCKLFAGALMLGSPQGIAGEAIATKEGQVCEDSWAYDYYSLGLGVNYVSSVARRGKVFYDGFQVVPFYSLDFFSPCLSLIGPTLYYRKQLTPYLLWRSNLNGHATREQPFYTTNGAMPEANKRAHSVEAEQVLEFMIPERGELGLMWSKDIKAHYGSYLEAKLRVVLAQFELGGLPVQPGLFVRRGWGSASHNRYLYAVKDAEASATHFEVGLSLAAPPVIDQYFPLFEVKYFRLLNDSFYEAAPYQKKEGWSVYAVYAKTIVASQ